MSLCSQNEPGAHSAEMSGTWNTFKRILQQVSQPCDKMLLYCSFGSKRENCTNIFNTVLTDDGLCCTFNAVDDKFKYITPPTDELKLNTPDMEGFTPVDWTPEDQYGDTNMSSNFYPRIAKGIGSRMGLSVLLNTSSREYFCTSTRSYGFKVMIHNPVEQPKIGNFGLLVTKQRETRISIKPSIQGASPKIKSMGIDKRHCLFSDEGNLTFYRTYSRKNCELECEAKYIKEYCNCILYYLPKVDPNSTICGPKDNKCTREVQRKMESADKNISCEICAPACYELGYDTVITSTQLVKGNFITKEDLPDKFFAEDLDGGESDLAIVHFYYGNNFFRSIDKEELFGFTEFLCEFFILLISNYLSFKVHYSHHISHQLAWKKNICKLSPTIGKIVSGL